MKPKLLFVDDSSDRIHTAIKRYSDEYDVVIAPNAKEALRKMTQDNYAIVSLDHDLSSSFEDPDSESCGMAIVRYIQKTGWPMRFNRPKFIIHSVNLFAATAMEYALVEMDFEVVQEKFYKRGIVAGAFDVIHPGYINLFRDAKSVCSYLIVALNVDPSIENPNKRKPFFSAEERTYVLDSIRYVDQVVPYHSEAELTEIFNVLRPDIRILGSDHKGQTSRPDLDFETYYRDRKENEWSTSIFRREFSEWILSKEKL